MLHTLFLHSLRKMYKCLIKHSFFHIFFIYSELDPQTRSLWIWAANCSSDKDDMVDKAKNTYYLSFCLKAFLMFGLNQASEGWTNSYNCMSLKGEKK